MQSQPAKQTKSILYSSRSLKIGLENSSVFAKDFRSITCAGMAALAARSSAKTLGREAMTNSMRASSDLEVMRSRMFCSVVPEPDARTASFMAEKIQKLLAKGTKT